MGYGYELSEENDDVAIRLEGVTVRYRIFDEKIGGIKEYLDKLFTHKLHHKEFLALNNLNLTIRKGERIGIIGHNGAGKSTLLKVIAHVIKPTEGMIAVSGSIAPLLELGAGFDIELTGEENIYLNGSILGKSKRYLDMVKEDIIDFAELGDFMYSAVKNYSSGMRAKLGFAVATQVDSDILLVDEVFGVGDENFKRKSKAKMIEMINSGKTVIIVSHDMTQMVDLTDRVIWMDNGEVVDDGEPEEICNKYCAYMLEHQNVVVETREARPVTRKVRKEYKKDLERKSGSKISRWAQKTGTLNKVLNDSSLRKEIIYDRRILREIENDDMFFERILGTDHALELIADNEDILDELLRKENVRARLKDESLLSFTPEKVIGKVWGAIDNCIYYRDAGVLYVKGWYMPVEAYTDVRISMGDEYLGDAQLHLIRKGINKDSSNPISGFPGWEFIQKVTLTGDTIKVSVFSHDKELAKDTVKVEMMNGAIPKAVAWKCENRCSQVECWELYQKHVMREFSFLSYEVHNKYNELLEENDGVGWLYKRNYSNEDGGMGFRLKINRLGLRGPSDTGAGNIVIGGGFGTCFGVDEDKAWFADKVFEKDWISLCYACEPNQLQRLLKKNLKTVYKSRRAIVLYEAAFWSVGISKEISVEKDREPLGVEEAFAKERESFYEFFNKIYEGVIRVVSNGERKLVNCRYAQFDFVKNAKKCEYVIQKWISILEEFDEIIVLRIPNKEYIYAGEAEDDNFGKLKENQDFGWKLFKTEMGAIRNIKFFEPDDFAISDYFCTSSYLNASGNRKLRKWISEM